MYLTGKVFWPGAAGRAAALALLIGVGAPAEAIVVVGLAFFGLSLLYIEYRLRDVHTTLRVHPATWVFVIAYVLLLVVGGLGWTEESGSAVAVSIVSAHVLAVLWRGVARDRLWALRWSRRIFTTLLAAALATMAIQPFRPVEFREEYVEGMGWAAGIGLYLFRVVVSVGMLAYVREALHPNAAAARYAQEIGK